MPLIAAAATTAGATAQKAADKGPAQKQAVQPRVLRVGPGQEFVMPSLAAQFARDGDTVEIMAGNYPADAAIWRANNLVIRGVGGRARLAAHGAHAEGKAIWVIKGNNTTVENIEFLDARVSARNGAGIRQEGAGLIVRNCLFFNNENGILTGANPASDILVEHSEFGLNGNNTGQTHNLYIGGVRSLTIRYSYIHRARGGHNVKSRAMKTVLLYNRIADATDGTASYEAEFSNGGVVVMIGNVIQQSPATTNSALVSYGAEGLGNKVNEFHAYHNTLVNLRPNGGRFFFLRDGVSVARIVNNLRAGRGEFLVGTAEQAGNVEIDLKELADVDALDFRPRPGARVQVPPAPQAQAHGVSLRPTLEYVHPMKQRARPDAAQPAAGALAPGEPK